ncbi:winged helix-turn-helix domain-containing protein [Mesorhizobium sp. BAC0120]|uniref:winged helix-turn-helix domain-containing protein n=1 Tax=Mesorhizobium sp. BAC0120 TaxID=3090670 RepID=UPI00298C414B|nr:winged helix-turn-helix domain-containing protein [Mesorhizobium sp. BAC0120]MDW6024157.1 winged helix-turn-helix domain-containing protein [Mesorhizobium sp. BAC0120]
MPEKISLKLARRIAIAAQGLAEPRPAGPADRRHLKKVLARNGLLQMDSVNVLVRAHYMPMFSRLGAYPLDLIDGTAKGRKRLLFEYWAHEASLLPVESWPLMRWRMERAARGERIYKGVARFGRDNADYVDRVYREVVERGPLAASDFDGERGNGGWWGWSNAKAALEWLFWAGRITAAERRPSFERVYDLPERALPAAVVGAPDVPEADAHRELLRISARALGVATATDLRDYFRLAPEDVKPRLPELVESGELLPVEVEGWAQQAWLHRDARLPRGVHAAALLSPFDPLVWERSRTERLFGFRYRIEIYTPAHKRVHGYYVLPFLYGDRLAARVDLKADRKQGVLKVQSAFAEPGAPPETAEALMREITGMAGWLGLERVEVAHSGDLAPALNELSAAPA